MFNFIFNDWWLVRILDKNCQRIQKNIGLDCFFFAKLFMWIALIYSILSPFIRYYIDFNLREPTIEFTTWLISTPVGSGQFTSIVFVLCLLRLFRKSYSITEIEKSVKNKSKQGLMNNRIFKERYGYGISMGLIFGVIIFITIFSIFPFGKNLTTWTLVFGLKSLYPYYISIALCACNPLPPRKSRLRSWWEKKREMISRQESDDLVPQPA